MNIYDIEIKQYAPFNRKIDIHDYDDEHLVVNADDDQMRVEVTIFEFWKKSIFEEVYSLLDTEQMMIYCIINSIQTLWNVKTNRINAGSPERNPCYSTIFVLNEALNMMEFGHYKDDTSPDEHNPFRIVILTEIVNAREKYIGHIFYRIETEAGIILNWVEKKDYNVYDKDRKSTWFQITKKDEKTLYFVSIYRRQKIYQSLQKKSFSSRILKYLTDVGREKQCLCMHTYKAFGHMITILTKNDFRSYAYTYYVKLLPMAFEISERPLYREEWSETQRGEGVNNVLSKIIRGGNKKRVKKTKKHCRKKWRKLRYGARTARR